MNLERNEDVPGHAVREFVALQRHSQDELLAIFALDGGGKLGLVMSVQDAGNLAVTVSHALREMGVVTEPAIELPTKGGAPS